MRRGHEARDIMFNFEGNLLPWVGQPFGFLTSPVFWTRLGRHITLLVKMCIWRQISKDSSWDLICCKWPKFGSVCSREFTGTVPTLTVIWISSDSDYLFRSICSGRGAVSISVFSLGSVHFLTLQSILPQPTNTYDHARIKFHASSESHWCKML